MPINSRDKGARGEREAAKALIDCFEGKVQARRGQQFSGSPDSPDVISSIPGIYWEIKRSERGSGAMQDWMAKAKSDGNSKDVPCVLHRKNNSPWIVTIHLSDLIEFSKRIHDVQKVNDE